MVKKIFGAFTWLVMHAMVYFSISNWLLAQKVYSLLMSVKMLFNLIACHNLKENKRENIIFIGYELECE